jgi:hypothetical protein
MIVPRLWPLPLVGKSPLQTVVAAEFIPMILIIVPEEFKLVRKNVIDADYLRVVVVNAFVVGLT